MPDVEPGDPGAPSLGDVDGGRAGGGADERSGDVNRTLAAFRQDLGRGRGPGISEAEWLANTSLRPTVAGVPTATSREELHLRTLRARGEHDLAADEAAWSTAQFRGLSGTEPAGSHRFAGPRRGAILEHPRARRRRRLLDVAAWLAVAWAWLRDRRDRRDRGGRKGGGGR